MKRFIHEQLENWKKQPNRKPLIIKGARQIGKTYSIRAFGEECFSNTHYINFEEEGGLKKIFGENLDPQKIINELNFYLNKSIDIKNDLLIFDEIQEAPRALTSLKYFQEKMPELALCAAGSLLGIHLNESSFPVGKVDFINMYPMSFEEFLRGTGDIKSFEFIQNIRANDKIPESIHTHLWEQLKIYFVVGGLPEVIDTYRNLKDNQFEALQQVRKMQNDLILAYNADMAKHSGKLNAMHIERLWRNVPAQLAKEQDGSASKFRFKGVVPGVNRYNRLAGAIDWLHAAGLIVKTFIIENAEVPLSAYVKESSFKLYLFDIGILGALSGLPAKAIMAYDYGTYKGYVAENLVAQAFLSSGERNLYGWKGNRSEVEFLRDIDGDILPIEVKSGGVTQAKSLRVFAEKYNSKYRTILSANNLHIDDSRRVHRYPLYLASRFPLK